MPNLETDNIQDTSKVPTPSTNPQKDISTGEVNTTPNNNLDITSPEDISTPQENISKQIDSKGTIPIPNLFHQVPDFNPPQPTFPTFDNQSSPDDSLVRGKEYLDMVSKSPRLSKFLGLKETTPLKNSTNIWDFVTPPSSNPSIDQFQSNSLVSSQLANTNERYSQYYTGMDSQQLEDAYANNQSWLGSLGKGLSQLVTKTLLYTAEGFSMMGSLYAGLTGINPQVNKYRDEGLDFASSLLMGSMDNSLVNWMEEQKLNLNDKWLPIYNTAKDQNSGFFKRMTTDEEFWTSDFVDGAAFMLQAIFSTKGLSSFSIGEDAVSGLNKVLKSARPSLALSDDLTGALGGITELPSKASDLSKLSWFQRTFLSADAARKINVGIAGTYNTGIEALQEGIGVKQDIINALDANPEKYGHLSQKDRDRIIARAAVNDAVINLPILMFSNFWEANLFTKKLPSTSSELSRFFKNGESLLSSPEVKTLNKLQVLAPAFKEIGTGIGWEGFWEENMQLAAERVNTNYALQTATNNPKGNPDYAGLIDLLNQGLKQIRDAYAGKDQEASLSIGLGALLGGGMGGGTNIHEQLQSYKEASEVANNIGAPTNAFGQYLRNKYIQEDYDTGRKDKDGNPILAKRIKLDDEGNPQLNIPNILSTLREQQNLYELTQLFHASKDINELGDFNKYLETDLLGRMAQAYFDSGLGDLLLEKFSIDPNAVAPDDLEIMGLDPSSTSPEEIGNKLAQYRETISFLQDKYDKITKYLPAASSDPDDLAANATRRAELIRLYSRQKALEDISKTYSKSNTLADQYEDLNLAKERSQEFLQKLIALNTVNPQAQTQYYINQTQEALDKTTKAISAFEKEHGEDLKQSQEEKETNERVLSPLDRADLRKNKVKLIEVQLALNSINERINRLSDLKSGLDYLNSYQNNKIADSQLNKVVRSRPKLTPDSEVGEYDNYEETNLRTRLIQNKYEDIDSQALAETLLEMPTTTQEERAQYLKTLRDANNQLLPEGLQDNIEKAQEVIEEEKKPLRDRMEEIIPSLAFSGSNPETGERISYTGEKALSSLPQLAGYVALIGPEAEEAYKRYNEQYKPLKDEVNKLDELFDNLQNNISPRQANSEKESDIKRSLAQQYIQDTDKLVDDFDKSPIGFDSLDILEYIQDQITQLENLRRILKESKRDEISEFKSLLPQINERLDKLKEIAEDTKKKISDRGAEEERSQKNQLNNSLSSLGLNPYGAQDTNLQNLHKNTIGKKYPKAYDEALKTIKDEGNDIPTRQAAIQALKKLVLLYQTESSPQELKAWKDSIDALRVSTEDKIRGSELFKTLSTYLSGRDNLRQLINSLPMGYKDTLKHLSKALTNPYKGEYSDRITSKEFSELPERKLEESFNLFSFQRNLENYKRDFSFTPPFSNEMILEVIPYLSHLAGIDELKNISPTSFSQEVENELNYFPKTKITPSEQQINSIREILDFINTPKELKPYSTMGYLRSKAGTGKTQIVAKGVSRLSGFSLSEIRAVATSPASTRELNTSLGLPITEENKDLDSVLEALKNEDTKETKLLFIDEAGRLGINQIRKIEEVISEINKERSQDQQLHVLLLGDPEQINSNTSGTLVLIPFIERESTPNITFFTPLTIRFRSNVQEINLLANKFAGVTQDISKEPLIVGSNIQDISNPPMESLGVYGTNTFETNTISYLKNTNLEDGKTRVIITSPKMVGSMENLLKDNEIKNVEVQSFIDIQGRTVDEAYINIPLEDVEAPGKFSRNRLYNQIMNVALTRAKNFIILSQFNTTNQFITDISQEKTGLEDKLKESKEKFTNNRNQEKETYNGIMQEKDSALGKTALVQEQMISTEEESTSDEGTRSTTEEDNSSPEEESPITEEEQTVKEEELFEDPKNEQEERENDLNYNTEDEEDEGTPMTPPEDIKDGSIESKVPLPLPPGIDPGPLGEHLLYHPTSTVTKDLYFSNSRTNKDGQAQSQYRFLPPNADGTLINSLLEEGYQKVDSGLMPGDKAYFWALKGDRGPIIYIAKKTEDDRYRQVAILSEEEMNKIQDPDLKDLIESARKNLDNLPTENEINPSKPQNIFQDKYHPKEITLSPNMSRTVTASSGLSMVYDSELLLADEATPIKMGSKSKTSLNYLLAKDLIDSIYPEGYTQKDLDNLVSHLAKKGTSKVCIFTNKDIRAKRATDSTGLVLMPGVPYYIIKGGIGKTSGGKDIYIRLDRMPLDPEKEYHQKYTKPLERFFGLMSEIQNYLNENLQTATRSENYGTHTDPRDNRKNSQLSAIGRGEINFLLHRIASLPSDAESITLTSDDFPDRIRSVKYAIVGLHNIPYNGFYLPLDKDIISKIREMVKLVDYPSEESLMASKEGDRVEGEFIYRGKPREYEILIPKFVLENNRNNEDWAQLYEEEVTNDTPGLLKIKPIELKNTPEEALKITLTLDNTASTEEVEKTYPFLKDFKKVITRLNEKKTQASGTYIHKSIYQKGLFKDWKTWAGTSVEMNITDSNTIVPGPVQYALNELFRAHHTTLKKNNIPLWEREVKKEVSMVKAPKILPISQDTMRVKDSKQEFNLNDLASLLYNSGLDIPENILGDFQEDIQLYIPIPIKRAHREFRVGDTSYDFPQINLRDTKDNTSHDKETKSFLPQIVRHNLIQVRPTVIGILRGEDNFSEGVEDIPQETVEIRVSEEIIPEEKSIEETPSDTSTTLNDILKMKEVRGKIFGGEPWEETLTKAEEVGGSELLNHVIEQIKNDPGYSIESLQRTIEDWDAKAYSLEGHDRESFEDSPEITKEEILNTMRKYFPSLSKKNLLQRVKFIDDATWFKNGLSDNQWGYFKKDVVYLRDSQGNNTAKKIVVLHELAHMVYDNFLTNKERAILQSEFDKTLPPNTRWAKPQDRQRALEEYLADTLSEALNESSINPSSEIKLSLNHISSVLRNILRRILNFFNFAYDEIKDLDDYIDAFKSARLGKRDISPRTTIDNLIRNNLKDGSIKKEC